MWLTARSAARRPGGGVCGTARRRAPGRGARVHQPGGSATSATHSQVVVATGGTLVFVAGQEPEDESGKIVGAGDLAAQARSNPYRPAGAQPN